MSSRRVSSKIWDEDWFIALSKDYKLFYLYAESQADQTGIWRPRKTNFQNNIAENANIVFDEFLSKVNKSDAHQNGTSVVRIRKLDNGNWFFTEYFTNQLGHVYKHAIGAHRGALKMLITNGIHPSEIPNFDWLGLETLDFQQLKTIVYATGIYKANMHQLLSMHSPLTKTNAPSLLNNEQSIGGVGENEIPVQMGGGQNPVSIPLNSLYQLDWDKVSVIPGRPKLLTQQWFDTWRRFVAFVFEREEYRALFNARKFLSPYDLQLLHLENGFKEEMWREVTDHMLAHTSGAKSISQDTNLYLRYKQYINYKRGVTKINNNGGVGTNGDEDFAGQRKW